MMIINVSAHLKAKDAGDVVAVIIAVECLYRTWRFVDCNVSCDVQAESFDGTGCPVIAIKGCRLSDWGGESPRVLYSSSNNDGSILRGSVVTCIVVHLHCWMGDTKAILLVIFSPPTISKSLLLGPNLNDRRRQAAKQKQEKKCSKGFAI